MRCRILRCALPCFAVLLLAVAAPAGAQTAPGAAKGATPDRPPLPWGRCAPNGAELKAAAQTLSGLKLSESQFIWSLLLVAGLEPDFVIRNSPISLPAPDGLKISIMFPLSVYAASAAEAIRKREPLAAVTMPAGITVVVTPETFGSPNIIKVVVERNGKTVLPTLNQLKPTVFTNAMGAKFTRYAGGLIYPCSAFDLGATVTITAIPESGENIVKSITDLERVGFWPKTESRAAAILEQHAVVVRRDIEERTAAIRKQHEEQAAAARRREEALAAAKGKHDEASLAPIRNEPASALMQLSAEDLKTLFGPPARVEGRRWTYLASDFSGDQLVLYLTETDVVYEVQPASFDLKRLKKR